MHRVGQDEAERTGMGGWEQPGPESEYEEYVRTTLVPSTYPERGIAIGNFTRPE